MLNDAGRLCDGIAVDSPARTEIVDRLLAVTVAQLTATVDAFPEDRARPWVSVTERRALVTWLNERKDGVANALKP